MIPMCSPSVTTVSFYHFVMLIMDRLLLMMVRSLMTTLITNTHLTDTQRVFLSDLYTTIICCLLVSIQHALCLGKSVRIHILYNILTSICQQYLSKRFRSQHYTVSCKIKKYIRPTGAANSQFSFFVVLKHFLKLCCH